VVGNVDDLSEIMLAPVGAEPSGRETFAAADVEELCDRMAEYWKKEGLSTPMPSMKLTTIQRQPLKKFTLFPQLPMELQLLV
jgi:hypothetical protein